MTATEPAYLARLREPLSSEVPDLPPPPTYTPPQAELEVVPYPLPHDQLDPDAVRIIRRLTENGFTAYLVGGCVRDLLFGLRPKDFDVVTSATPRDMRRLFRNCRIIGRRFRLAHVFFRDKIIEVATFRANSSPAANGAEAELEAIADAAALETMPDAALENGTLDVAETDPTVPAEAADAAPARRGKVPESGLLIRDDNTFGTPEEDAVRRDFTVNALFYDVEKQVILDYVGGVADAKKKEIRTIGDPRIRMREDPIRMLRAIRLAARMGCTIEPATWEAIVMFRHELLHAAAPRVSEDILRMFRGGAITPAVDMLIESGLLEVILPELHAHLARRLADEGPEEVEALRAALTVADAKTQAGEALTAAVQFAVLLAPILLAPLGENGRQRPVTTEAMGDRMRPIGQRLAISKKDGERVRQILATLPKLLPPAPGKKRRTAGPLLRRAFFPETVEFFDVMAHATGECLDEVSRWRRKLEENPPPPPEAKTPRRQRGKRRPERKKETPDQPVM